MLQNRHSLEMAGGQGLRISELAQGCGDSRDRGMLPSDHPACMAGGTTQGAGGVSVATGSSQLSRGCVK